MHHPLAANADPTTSHDAADRHTASGRRGAHCDRVLALVRAHPGSTSVELYEAQEGEGLDRHEVSRRLSDLMHAGKVRQGHKRPCRVKGVEMVTWHPELKQGELF
jgi:hypothetical protein